MTAPAHAARAFRPGARAPERVVDVRPSWDQPVAVGGARPPPRYVR